MKETIVVIKNVQMLFMHTGQVLSQQGMLAIVISKFILCTFEISQFFLPLFAESQ